MEIDLRNIKVRPIRVLHREPFAVCLEAELKESFGFAFLGRDKAYDILVESHRNNVGLYISSKTVLVFLLRYLF